MYAWRRQRTINTKLPILHNAILRAFKEVKETGNAGDFFDAIPPGNSESRYITLRSILRRKICAGAWRQPVCFKKLGVRSRVLVVVFPATTAWCFLPKSHLAPKNSDCLFTFGGTVTRRSMTAVCPIVAVARDRRDVFRRATKCYCQPEHPPHDARKIYPRQTDEPSR
jgi:hypothetical protein